MLNKDIAAELASAALADLRNCTYSDLRAMLEDKIHQPIKARDGKKYNVVTYIISDLDDSLRVTVAVDNGGLSALKPLVRDFVIQADGTIVG